METSLIFDYIDNVKGVTPEKIYHVEDYIETHPENPEQTMAVYSLYTVDFKSEKNVYYIQIASSSANIVVPADPAIMSEIFPDYAKPSDECTSTSDRNVQDGGGPNTSANGGIGSSADSD